MFSLISGHVGTLMAPSTTSSEQDIIDTIKQLYRSTPELDTAIARLLQLYPDVPALGSPYNTGDELFGLSSQFKRAAALRESHLFIFDRRDN